MSTDIDLAKLRSCRIRRCDERIELNNIMCGRHWNIVPPSLQAAVYAAWQARRVAQAEFNKNPVLLTVRDAAIRQHRAAVQAAVDAVEAQLDGKSL
jgi:hypothetical protein